MILDRFENVLMKMKNVMFLLCFYYVFKGESTKVGYGSLTE